MADEGSKAPAALRIARQILSREGVPSADAPPAVIADALERVCDRMSVSLCDALGAAGYDALLARSLARAEAAHPALKDICRRDGGGVQMEIVLANVEAHGIAGVT